MQRENVYANTVMAAENSSLPSHSQYYCFYCILSNKINATLISIRNKNIKDSLKYLVIYSCK